MTLLPLTMRAAIAPALMVASATTAIAWSPGPLAHYRREADLARVTITLLDPDPLRQTTAMAAIEVQARRARARVRPIDAHTIRQALGRELSADLAGAPVPQIVQIATTPVRARSVGATLRAVPALDVQVDQPQIRRSGWPRALVRLMLLLLALGAAATAGFALVHGRTAGLALLHRLGATPGQLTRDAIFPLMLMSLGGSIAAAAAIRFSAPAGANADWIAAMAVMAACVAGGVAALPGLWRACS